VFDLLRHFVWYRVLLCFIAQLLIYVFYCQENATHERMQAQAGRIFTKESSAG